MSNGCWLGGLLMFVGGMFTISISFGVLPFCISKTVTTTSLSIVGVTIFQIDKENSLVSVVSVGWSFNHRHCIIVVGSTEIFF